MYTCACCYTAQHMTHSGDTGKENVRATGGAVFMRQGRHVYNCGTRTCETGN